MMHIIQEVFLKNLVYFSLKSLGLETFDQFENSNLIEYILGEGASGSVYFMIHLLITIFK